MNSARLRASAFVFFTATLALHAQVVGGTITGVITDPSGAIVQHANVLVRNEETGTHRISPPATTAASPPSPSPPAATPSPRTPPGFASYKLVNLPLTVGQSINLHVSLQISGNETVDVSAHPLGVNLSTEETSGVVDARQVKDLPLNGRSYDQLLTLNPATVNYTGQRSGTVGTSNSSVGNMFSISGRRPQDNLYLLNGIEYTGASLINVTPGGTSGQLLGVDGIREFNVISDSYSAAYGKRDGAQISIVTESGTNHVHGAAYEFLRNSFFDARNYFDQSRIPEFQRNNFGASLGGPLRTNKLFLFGNYEGYRQNLGLSDVTLVPDNRLARCRRRTRVEAAAQPLARRQRPRAPQLQRHPHRHRRRLLLTAPQHIREDFGTTRFDGNITPSDLLFAVYTVDDSTATHTHTKPLLARSTRTSASKSSACKSSTSSPPRLLNTARFGYSRASFYFLGSLPADIQAVTPTFVPGKPTGAVVIAGSTASNGASHITTAGANAGSNNAITRNLFTFDDHVFWTIGHHQLEIGAWLQRLQSNDNLAQNQYGQASFASLKPSSPATSKPSPTSHRPPSSAGAHSSPPPTSKTPSTSRRASKSAPASAPNPPPAGTNRKAAPASTSSTTVLSIPTRPSNPAHSRTTAHSSFLSRASASPGMSSATAAPASAPPPACITHCLTHSTTASTRPRPSTPRSPTPAPRSPRPPPAPRSISPSTVQTDIHTPALVSYTFRIEQQLAPATTLSVGYLGSHSYHQILSGDLNEPAYRHATQRHHLLPHHHQGQPRARQHHLLVLRRHRQLQRARSRPPPRPHAWHQLPRELHLVEEPRQRLRLEHLRLREHTRVRLRPLTPEPRLRPRRH